MKDRCQVMNGFQTTSSTHSREGIDRVPVAVPVIHNDCGRRDARNTEFLCNVRSQHMEAWRPVCPGNMQVLFGARYLRGKEGSGERRTRYV